MTQEQRCQLRVHHLESVANIIVNYTLAGEGSESTRSAFVLILILTSFSCSETKNPHNTKFIVILKDDFGETLQRTATIDQISNNRVHCEQF